MTNVVEDSYLVGCYAELLGIFRRFEGLCCVHIRGYAVQEEYITLNMIERDPFERSLTTYQLTENNISEDLIVHRHRYENLRSHTDNVKYAYPTNNY